MFQTSIDPVWEHFGNWVAVILWIVIYGVTLAFIPFYKKSHRKSSSVYIAFIVAYALEMFGVPFSMFIIGAIAGSYLPDGILWGHTLVQYIGLWGTYIGLGVTLFGVLLIILGWRTIYKNYWSKEKGEGKLVTSGLYKYIRHPQYTGFFLITLGMVIEWATLPLLILWPILIYIYYRLAKKEEADMISEFGEEYIDYKESTGMFLPKIW